MLELGTAIQRCRMVRGMTLDDLVAALSGVKGTDRSAISKIENNLRWPKADTLVAIARVFSMQASELIAMAEGVSRASDAPKLKKRDREILQTLQTLNPTELQAVTAVITALRSKPTKK